jgi:hypothetical protein
MSDYAEHWISMDWYPVIEVVIDAEDRHTYRNEITKKSIAFGIERYYISQSPVGEIFTVEWDVDEKHRKAQMEHYGGGYGNNSYSAKIRLAGLPLGAPLKKDDGWLMDYNEELWQGFKGVQKGIEQLTKRLRELVGTKQGLQQLLSRDGAKLLLKQ